MRTVSIGGAVSGARAAVVWDSAASAMRSPSAPAATAVPPSLRKSRRSMTRILAEARYAVFTHEYGDDGALHAAESVRRRTDRRLPHHASRRTERLPASRHLA